MELAAFLVSMLVSTCISFKVLTPPDSVAEMVAISIHQTLRACEWEQPEPTMEVSNDLMGYWVKDFPFERLDDNAGCLATCALSRLGWLNASDQLNEAKFAQYLSGHQMKLAKETKEKQIDVVRKCYTPKNGTQAPCDPGVEFLKCYHDTMFELGWNPSVPGAFGTTAPPPK